MQSDNGRRGLCLSCKNAEDCTFPRSPDRPVNQCDEYACDGPAPRHNSGGNPSDDADAEEYS